MSNLTDIGFILNSREELSNLAEIWLKEGTKIEFEGGSYVHYEVGNGIEIWVTLDKDNNYLSFNPHFNGRSSRFVSITETSSNMYHDVEYQAWALDPNEKGTHAGLFPFTFEMPDGHLNPKFTFPHRTHIQLTGFANTLEYFDDIQSFKESQQGDLKLPVYFYGSPDMHEESANPRPYGTFIGTIAEFELLENPMTRNKFYWILVNTYGGQIDIVAAPSFFKKEPAIDGVVYGFYWLSARLHKSITNDNVFVKEKSSSNPKFKPMKFVLFNNGSTTTGVDILYSGEVLISQQEFSGDYVIRIKKEQKIPFLNLLMEKTVNRKNTYILGFISKLFGNKFPEDLSEPKVDENIRILLKRCYGRNTEDPFDHLKKLLRESEVKHKMEYWPDR